MVGKGRGWRRPAGLAMAMFAGCQASGGGRTPLIFTQMPPTVQAAYNEDHRGTVVQDIGRTSHGGEDYYTVHYTADDGAKHDVVYNGAGNEIDKH